MQITLDRKGAIVFSPWGERERPFTDVGGDGKDIVIGKGRSLADLARIYYGISTVTPISAKFSFLDRDNKEREYDPAKEDGYVFSSNASIQKFKTEATRLLQFLTQQWKELNLPVKMDKDRKVEVPDNDAIWNSFATNDNIDKIIQNNRDEVMFILSNVDIIKKACIVRGVIPGWWAASYSGKDAPDLGHFRDSLDAHVKAIHILEKTPTYKRLRNELSHELGDPLDTNVGYPLYSAAMDEFGNPITRLKTLEIFKGIGTQGFDVAKLFREIDKRAAGLGLEGHPLAIAPIRRNSYGWKWNHVFDRTSNGLVTSHDERGGNTTRVAWAVPYVFNLIMSPLQAEWKTARKMLPGLFHDGESKMRRIEYLKKTKPWVAEADYSNYDRFMPVNMVLAFSKQYLSNKRNPNYWLGLIYALHHKMPLIWPDYVGEYTGRGLVFTPNKIGLLSGVKITSEEGTFVNSIVTGQSLIDAGVMNKSGLLDYLVQYKDGGMGSKKEYIHIQSDDTEVIDSSASTVKKIVNAFVANMAHAGLKGEAMLGDRFLMRHTLDGRDTPVPTRVWQNTLQNETPPENAIKFIVGLAMRTDGLLGHKTFDPFNTGALIDVTKTELLYTIECLKSLREFISTSAHPQRSAINYLDAMLEAANRMNAKGGRKVKMNAEDATLIDTYRKKFLDALAKLELENLKGGLIAKDGKGAATLLYELHKNSNIPSQLLLLQQLLKAVPALGNIMNNIENKENTFYLHAMKTMRLPLTM